MHRHLGGLGSWGVPGSTPSWPSHHHSNLLLAATASLCCSTFRDFPADHLLPASGAAGGDAAGGSGSGPGEYRLNPWQVRHCTGNGSSLWRGSACIDAHCG